MQPNELGQFVITKQTKLKHVGVAWGPVEEAGRGLRKSVTESIKGLGNGSQKSEDSSGGCQ